MKIKNLRTVFVMAMLIITATTAMAATKAMFITGGQSNTDGRLYAATLPTYLQAANNYCLASNQWPYDEARLGTFYPYYPTSGTTGQYSRWAYDAVTYYYIGQALQETFYVAKTSFGGTSIDPSVSNSGGTVNDKPFVGGYGSGYHWSADPTFLAATGIAGANFEKDATTYTGQSMLKAWIANIDAAIDAIVNAGDTPDIKAIIWHQGESDKNAAGNYYNNLKTMVAYVRQHLVTKTGNNAYANLPFFCGTIPHASSLCNSTVEKAFFTLQDEDANFHVIDLRDLTMLSDTKHFDAPSAELFGKRLFNRMVDENVITGDKLPVEYAQVDYSDFGTDEFFGETKTVTFNLINSDLKMTTYCHDNLYLHSNNMNSRAFVSASTSVGSVTFADGTEQTVTRTLTPKTGANGWTVDNIAKEANASQNKQVAVAANVLYPGRFSIMMSAPDATSESPITMQLIFNGSIVAEKSFTSGSEIYELYYDAPQAGTFFMHPGGRCTLYAVRYKAATDRTSQRTITTDADGYATFGNLTGANLGLPAGLTAWAVAPSTINDQMVEMTQLLGVDKGTGVILQGAPSTEYTLPFAWTAQNYDGENAMTAQQTTGDIEETSGEDFVNYTFANKQFTKVSTPVSVEAGKSYLSISNGAAQCAYSTLILEKPDESDFEPTEVTVGESGYAVFSNLTDTNLTLPQGLTAYALLPGEIDDDVAKLVPVTAIGAGQAVLIKGTSGSYTLNVDALAVSDVASGNLLVAVEGWQKPLETNPSTGNKQYLLNGSEFTLGNGKKSVYKGEAILSVPAGDAMAAYSVVKLAPTAVSYEKVDITQFGTDEVVSAETTWLTGEMTTPGSDGTVQQVNGLYGRGQNGSTNRSFYKQSVSGSATFSDGTAVNWSSYLYINADYSGAWSLSASTTAKNTSCGDYLAFNAAVPGTVYVLFSSKGDSESRTLDLYHEGSKVASATSTGNADIKEIKYTATAAGTILLDCRKTCRVYALRFVPTDNSGIYERVTEIGWSTMSLPYPAVVPTETVVYYVSAYQDGGSEGTLTLKKVDAGEIIPAKAGFLFNGTQGLYRFEKSMTPATWNDNLLVGTADAALTGYDYTNTANPIFVLAKLDNNTVGFKKFAGTSIAQYKAYLQVGSTSASSFSFIFDDATGVSQIENGKWKMENSVFDLQGRQVSASSCGIRIVRYADGSVRKLQVK